MSEITEAQTGRATNFIRNIIEEDLAAGVNQPRLWCGHPAPYSEQAANGVPDPAKIRRASRRNRTVICILGTPRASA